jgi:hypothetical protein
VGLGDALKRLGRLGAAGASHPEPGPIVDPGSLVTPDEIEAVTGGRPTGEPRRNGERGSEVDVGRLLIWEAQLTNGDQFLVTLIAGNDGAAAKLAMSRIAEEAKPLEDVGERGLVRVKKYPKKGSSEIGVNALAGSDVVSLTHTSTEGRSDPAPLADLLRTALTRL